MVMILFENLIIIITLNIINIFKLFVNKKTGITNLRICLILYWGIVGQNEPGGKLNPLFFFIKLSS